MRRIADLTVAMLVGMSVHVASAQQSQKEVDLEALLADIKCAVMDQASLITQVLPG